MSKTISPPDFTSRFTDNPALKGREEKFVTCEVKVAPVLASWQESMFAHEWLNSEGQIKKTSEMAEKVQARRKDIESHLAGNAPLERPVLGIGILDNIEIGSGKDLFLSLAALGLSTIPVHIPKSHENDFRMFIR
jgi:hypothetical protein